MDGLQVIQDSKFFDSIDWQPVKAAEDVSRVPIEPAYYVRRVRLKKTDPGRQAFLAEFNTSGYAVVPVSVTVASARVYEVGACPARPLYRLNKTMSESTAKNKLTRTTYLPIDLSGVGNEEEFEVVIRAIYFNGAQDQIHRRYRSGRRVKRDWWGSRS